MPEHLIELREACATAGWQVERVVENALTSEGVTFDVTRIQARRQSLWANMTVLRNCSNPLVSEREIDHWGPPHAIRQRGTTKVRVEVCDGGRSMEELRVLAPPTGTPATFARLLETLGSRRWRVDESREDDYDFTWTIHAVQGEDHLSLGVTGLSCLGPAQEYGTVYSSSDGRAYLVRPEATWGLRILSARYARELAEALLRG